MKSTPKYALVGLISIFALAAQAEVVINEIMYNTPGSPDVEWIELYNNGSSTVELDDWYLIDGNDTHPHCNLLGDLLPGHFLVVVGDFALFTPQYPGVTTTNINAFDPSGTGFGLGNGGDTIFMYDDDGVLVDTVTYDDGGSWPGSPDGDGPSLELVNPGLDNNTATAWDPSEIDGGTPGEFNSVYVNNQPPIIHDTDRTPRLPEAGESVLIGALVSDASDLDRVELWVDLGAGFAPQPMFDDGLHGDGAAADSLFAAVIPAQTQGALVRYYVLAFDEFGQVVSKPSGAPASFRAYTVGYTPTTELIVSEIMASNNTTLADEFGEFDDWVEILNTGQEPINLQGMFLTDNFGDHRKWMLPGTTLASGDYLLIWCDDEPQQGALHATFKLSGGGEDIALYDTEEHGNTLLHGFQFGIQNPDIGYGINPITVGLPDKSVSGFQLLPEYLLSPTPGQPNDLPSSSVVINEFLTTSEAGGVDDWIEFYNRSNQLMDISGWGVSDDASNPLKWVFPIGTMLAPNGYFIVDEVALGFSLSSSGEEIQLSSADGLRGIDFIGFGQQQPDISFGRAINSLWGFMDPPTPSEPNPNHLSPVDHYNLPLALTVSGAYPNPFNPTTNIHFELPKASRVNVNVYSVDGRLVRTIDGGLMAAGSANITFNGLDNHGRRLSSGVFFARISTDEQSVVVKMMMVK